MQYLRTTTIWRSLTLASLDRVTNLELERPLLVIKLNVPYGLLQRHINLVSILLVRARTQFFVDGSLIDAHFLVVVGRVDGLFRALVYHGACGSPGQLVADWGDSRSEVYLLLEVGASGIFGLVFEVGHLYQMRSSEWIRQVVLLN